MRHTQEAFLTIRRSGSKTENALARVLGKGLWHWWHMAWVTWNKDVSNISNTHNNAIIRLFNLVIPRRISRTFVMIPLHNWHYIYIYIYTTAFYKLFTPWHCYRRLLSHYKGAEQTTPTPHNLVWRRSEHDLMKKVQKSFLNDYSFVLQKNIKLTFLV